MTCIDTSIAVLALVSCVITATLASMVIDKAIEKYAPKKKRGRICKTSTKN